MQATNKLVQVIEELNEQHSREQAEASKNIHTSKHKHHPPYHHHLCFHDHHLMMMIMKTQMSSSPLLFVFCIFLPVFHLIKVFLYQQNSEVNNSTSTSDPPHQR